jgi:hypothetical protein
MITHYNHGRRLDWLSRGCRMQNDDEDAVAENESDVFSEPKSIFRLFVEGNNRATLIFLAVTLGALLATAIMSGHFKVSHGASPPKIRHLFWFAGLHSFLPFSSCRIRTRSVSIAVSVSGRFGSMGGGTGFSSAPWAGSHARCYAQLPR